MYFGAFMASLDIILPAYNPLPGWEEIVIGRFQSLEKALPGTKIGLIIVNDGSKSITERGVDNLLKKHIPNLKWISYEENRGKGFALREGVNQSHADYILYTDIDWPYVEESVIAIIGELINGTDAVIGVRDEKYYGHLPSGRRTISRMLRKMNAMLLRLKVSDTQAGLKGFSKEVKQIFLSTTIDRYLFDLEFIYLLSARKNISVRGIPIRLREGISFSKMNRKVLLQEAGNFLSIWLRRKKRAG